MVLNWFSYSVIVFCFLLVACIAYYFSRLYHRTLEKLMVYEKKYNDLDAVRNAALRRLQSRIVWLANAKRLSDEKPPYRTQIVVLVPKRGYFNIGENRTVDFWDNYWSPFTDNPPLEKLSLPDDSDVYWMTYDRFKEVIFAELPE